MIIENEHNINFKNWAYVPETDSVLSSCLFHSGILFIGSWKPGPAMDLSLLICSEYWTDCVQPGSIQVHLYVIVRDVQEMNS